MEDYRVFARAEYAEPLELRGSLRAADDRAAADQALRRFGRDWVELVLLPEREIHWVLRGPLPEGAGEPHERGGRSPPRAPRPGGPADQGEAGDG